MEKIKIELEHDTINLLRQIKEHMLLYDGINYDDDTIINAALKTEFNELKKKSKSSSGGL